MSLREWVSFGNTSILLERKTDHLIPEWQPVAQVTERQIYENMPAKWYAWIGGAPGGPTHTLLGHFPGQESARIAVTAVFERLDATWSPKDD